MKISFSFDMSQYAKHAKPEHAALLLAYFLNHKHVIATRVEKRKSGFHRFTVEFDLAANSDLKFPHTEGSVEAEVKACLDLDPCSCPCGCGAFLALYQCISLTTQDNERLTDEEHELVKNNQKIHAIKSVRMRTGLGLKDAKDLVDKYYPPVPY